MTDIPKFPMDSLSGPYDHEIIEPSSANTIPLRHIMKRLCDIVIGVLLVIMFLPLMLLIAGLSYGLNGGNVLFAHRRVGKDGNEFNCLKFRTMVDDAEERLADILANDPKAAKEWEVKQKLRRDPRILPGVGHFLRQSSLDELPQIINVLLGDMSLVGPRPVVQSEMAHYGHFAKLYYSVRPGLTGPWQIGGRSECDFATRVKLDVNYINNWTFFGDIKILASTAFMVLRLRSSSAY
ncbi:sugar transferase [Sulfitobacter aestuarii]|uniref:Sugar transferase n=1 Tax=Sulfitobacter aestuarii TaxID=2161676 RepID=A0ABW5U334_9RHOB